jgi:PleD family two-component response regulator
MGRARILIVDNDQDFRESLLDWLEIGGFHVYEASTADEAQAVLNQKEIDLILVDVRLADDDDPEDLSGLHFCQVVDPTISKLVLTGYPPPPEAWPDDPSAEAGLSVGEKTAPITIKSESPAIILQAIEYALEQGDRHE